MMRGAALGNLLGLPVVAAASIWRSYWWLVGLCLVGLVINVYVFRHSRSAVEGENQ